MREEELNLKSDSFRALFPLTFDPALTSLAVRSMNAPATISSLTSDDRFIRSRDAASRKVQFI